MQRLLPVATVRVVSAVTDSSQAESVLEDECGTIDEEVGMESVDLEDDDDDSDLESDISSPISLRVARFLESGKPAGPKKRKRAKLNHLSSEQKVERRKILNRIAAQTARDRKKVQMDELERFVKELASENLRLARENAELRQKSTDFEVENAKLRTQLERSSANQWPVVAKQEAPSTGQFSAVTGAMRGDSRAVDNDVKPGQLARPVGIAARVNDPSAKPTDSACCRSAEETGVLESARASNFNRMHTEAKRARVANTTECVRTQNGVSDAAQRNAAAAVFVRAPRASAFHRPVRTSGRRPAQRVAVPRGADGSQCPSLPSRSGPAPSRAFASVEAETGRFGNSGPAWSDRQAAQMARCVSECVRAPASTLATPAPQRRCAHAVNCGLHVGATTRMPVRERQMLDASLDDTDALYAVNAQGGAVSRSLSGTTMFDESMCRSDVTEVTLGSGCDTNESDSSGELSFLSDEVVIPSGNSTLPLSLDGGQIVDDFLNLFTQNGVEPDDCGATGGVRTAKMDDLFEKLVADLEFN